MKIEMRQSRLVPIALLGLALAVAGCGPDASPSPPSPEPAPIAPSGNPAELALRNMAHNKVLAAHSGAVFSEERSSIATGELTICGLFTANDASDGGYIASISSVRYAAIGGRKKVQEVCGNGAPLGVSK